jgi:hypothetical protein
MTIQYKGRVDTLIKNKIKCFPRILYKEIQMGSGEKSNMTIYFIRKPFLIYDFAAPGPF